MAPCLETVPLEHERDLTNSSTERVTLPSIACLGHYALLQAVGVLAALRVDQQRAHANLLMGGGRQLAERIMMALADKLGAVRGRRAGERARVSERAC